MKNLLGLILGYLILIFVLLLIAYGYDNILPNMKQECDLVVGIGINMDSYLKAFIAVSSIIALTIIVCVLLDKLNIFQNLGKGLWVLNGFIFAYAVLSIYCQYKYCGQMSGIEFISELIKK